MYCWDSGTSKIWDILDTWLDLVVLALPIIPITISCVLSCVYVRRKGKYLSEMSCGMTNSNRATCTIILMTAVYILFNIPLFVNYIFWTIIENSPKWEYPDPFYKTQFTYWYLWNISDCLFINLNSLVNPLIYFMRIKKFKDWVYKRTQYLKGRVLAKFVL